MLPPSGLQRYYRGKGESCVWHVFLWALGLNLRNSSSAKKKNPCWGSRPAPWAQSKTLSLVQKEVLNVFRCQRKHPFTQSALPIRQKWKIQESSHSQLLPDHQPVCKREFVYVNMNYMYMFVLAPPVDSDLFICKICASWPYFFCLDKIYQKNHKEIKVSAIK